MAVGFNSVSEGRLDTSAHALVSPSERAQLSHRLALPDSIRLVPHVRLAGVEVDVDGPEPVPKPSPHSKLSLAIHRRYPSTGTPSAEARCS
jgi:hypothetical protein